MGSTWVQEGWHLQVAMTQAGMQQTNVCVNPAAVWIPLSPPALSGQGFGGGDMSKGMEREKLVNQDIWGGGAKTC